MTTINFNPATLNIKTRRGDTVAVPFVIWEGGVPANITGRTFNAELRRAPSSSISSRIQLVIDVVSAPAGSLTLNLDAPTTANLKGKYEWSLVQHIGVVVRTLVIGHWDFDEAVV